MQKIGRVISSPVVYIRDKFKPGGIKGSIFTLIAATLGGGTISLPYAVSENGYVLGPILILLGALVSYYTGMLLVAVGEKVDTDKYEVMALEAYGDRCRKITSVMLVVCLVGFVISYIIFVKELIPFIIAALAGKDEKDLPGLIKN